MNSGGEGEGEQSPDDPGQGKGAGGYQRHKKHHFQTHELAGVSREFVLQALGASDVEDAVQRLQQLRPQQLRAAFEAVYKSPTASENKKWLQRRLAEALQLKPAKYFPLTAPASSSGRAGGGVKAGRTAKAAAPASRRAGAAQGSRLSTAHASSSSLTAGTQEQDNGAAGQGVSATQLVGGRGAEENVGASSRLAAAGGRDYGSELLLRQHQQQLLLQQLQQAQGRMGRWQEHPAPSEVPWHHRQHAQRQQQQQAQQAQQQQAQQAQQHRRQPQQPQPPLQAGPSLELPGGFLGRAPGGGLATPIHALRWYSRSIGRRGFSLPVAYMGGSGGGYMMGGGPPPWGGRPPHWGPYPYQGPASAFHVPYPEGHPAAAMRALWEAPPQPPGSMAPPPALAPAWWQRQRAHGVARQQSERPPHLQQGLPRQQPQDQRQRQQPHAQRQQQQQQRGGGAAPRGHQVSPLDALAATAQQQQQQEEEGEEMEEEEEEEGMEEEEEEEAGGEEAHPAGRPGLGPAPPPSLPLPLPGTSLDWDDFPDLWAGAAGMDGFDPGAGLPVFDLPGDALIWEQLAWEREEQDALCALQAALARLQELRALRAERSVQLAAAAEQLNLAPGGALPRDESLRLALASLPLQSMPEPPHIGSVPLPGSLGGAPTGPALAPLGEGSLPVFPGFPTLREEEELMRGLLPPSSAP